MTLKVDGTNGVLQAYDYQVQANNFSYTFAAGTQVLVLDNTGPVPTGTVKMPASPADGMTITITTAKLINALTVNANTGQSIVGGGALSLGAGQGISYIYNLANATWFPYAGSLPLATKTNVTGVTTTVTVIAGSSSLAVTSATGINVSDYIVGEGIAPGTYVSVINGTTVSMSASAAVTLSNDPVTFYSTGKALTPATTSGMLCRAWVNFNGTIGPTVPIRASYNVSSITDNGTGDYTVNFTTAMADANYSIVATCSNDGTTIRTVQQWTAATTLTTSCKLYVATTNTTAASDSTIVAASIFR